MKQSIIVLMFLLFSSNVFSTHQVEDYLIFDSDTLWFYEPPPLEQSDSIVSLNIEKYRGYDFLSSGCWRGFYVEWKIIDNTLYLSKIFDCATYKEVDNIEIILNCKFTNGLLKADWVNGFFWCGNNLVVEKTLYLSVYGHERKLLIEKGKIIKKDEYNFIPCDYEDENKLLNFILQTFDWGTFPVNSLLQFEAELSIDSSGKIERIKILRSNNANFDNEIIKGLSQLPCWAIYYRKGEVYNYRDWISMKIRYDRAATSSGRKARNFVKSLVSLPKRCLKTFFP